jgi:hypothetical protein
LSASGTGKSASSASVPRALAKGSVSSIIAPMNRPGRIAAMKSFEIDVSAITP